MKKINEQYTGYNNVRLKALEQEKIKHQIEYKRMEKEIEDIRNNCDHELLFVSTGMYDDLYKCRICGYEKWI